MDSTTLLNIVDLKKYFFIRDRVGRRTNVRALDGVSLAIERGKTLGVVGESGCGKTTLGRAVLRLIEPDSGSIIYNGEDITHINMRPYRSKMQIVFQDPAGSLDPRSRISDIISEGLRINKSCSSEAHRKSIVSELLDSVGLEQGTATCYPHELSGGQQQRVGIARALAVEPEFIVCDEPVSALDVSYQSQIINLLVELQSGRGLTYLFISHDLSVVQHISDEIAVMYMGKVVEFGTGEEVISNPAHQYTHALLDAIPVPDPRVSRERDRKLVEEFVDLEIPEHGCRYARLCEHATPRCFDQTPELAEISVGHLCACHLYN